VEATHISVILDRTGSMDSIRDDTIGGFNAFLADQRAIQAPTTFTLVQFDSEAPFEVLHAFAPIAAVQPLTRETYVPRANTPLYDAIGRGITGLDDRLAAMPPAERPKRIVFVIVTDGEENASREFTGREVRRLITARRRDGWQFVFLSADEAAIKDGEGVAIHRDYSMGVAKGAQGSRDMWDAAVPQGRLVPQRQLRRHGPARGEGADRASSAGLTCPPESGSPPSPHPRKESP